MEADDVTKGQSNASFGRDRGMRARQNQAEQIVVNRERVSMHGRLIDVDLWERSRERLEVEHFLRRCSAQDVDRTTRGDRPQPRARPFRNSRAVPRRRSDGEGILHGVFGKVEIAEAAGETCNESRALRTPRDFYIQLHLAETASISRSGRTGLTSMTPVRAFGTRAAQSSAESRSGTSIK